MSKLPSELLQQVRNETSGIKNVIHFNNAGASLMPDCVVKAMIDHLELEARIGGYEAAAAMHDQIEDFYVKAAELLHCQPHNIAFTSNATDAYNRALSSIPLKKGDIILTSNDDYVSNYIAFISLKKRMGIEIKRINNIPEGGIDVEDAEQKIRQFNPVLFSLSHVPTSSGLVQPVAAIGDLCRKYEIPYLVDACQSIGQIDLHMDDIGCDFLSVTSRKFLRGPRGAGFLFVSDSALQKKWYPLFIDMEGATWTSAQDFDLRSSARRFEDWECPYALLLGSKAAVEYALNIGMTQIERAVLNIRQRTEEALLKIPRIRVLDKGRQQCGIVTIHMQNTDPLTLKNFLSDQNINTSIVEKSSAVIDFKEKGIDWALRISPHYYNSSMELEQLVDSLSQYRQ